MLMDMITRESERAQTMAEYAVVLAVITAAIITSFSLLSGTMEAAFDRTVDLVRLVV